MDRLIVWLRWGGRGEGVRDGCWEEREARRGGEERAVVRVADLFLIKVRGDVREKGGGGGRTICRGGFRGASVRRGRAGEEEEDSMFLVGGGSIAGGSSLPHYCYVRRRVFEAAVGGVVDRCL